MDIHEDMHQTQEPELGAVGAGLPTENAINTDITAPVMWSTRETCGEHQTTKRLQKQQPLITEFLLGSDTWGPVFRALTTV